MRPGITGLGTLRVSQGGASSRFPPSTKPATGEPLYLEHVNQQGKIIDFGPVRTDGSVLIERAGSPWVRADLSPRPGLHVAPRRKPVRPAGRDPLRRWSRRSTVPIPEGAFWKLPLHGASQYKWNAH